MMELRSVTAEDAPLLYRAFQKAKYQDCNYNVVNVFLWKNIDPLFYAEMEDYVLLFIRNEDQFLAFAPLCEPQYLEAGLTKLISIFEEYHLPVTIPWCPHPVKEKLEQMYPGRFTFQINRSETEYVYRGEKLRTYSGKAMQKKRNHVNWFLRNYEGRFEFKELSTQSCKDCITLVERWMCNREPSIALQAEHQGIIDLFSLANVMEFRIGGVFIDGQLEGFSICSWLIDQTVVQCHVEKANGEIRGLYPYLVMKMQTKYYPNALLVNREDDVGVEMLRKSKESYQPDEYWEKYYCNEKKG